MARLTLAGKVGRVRLESLQLARAAPSRAARLSMSDGVYIEPRPRLRARLASSPPWVPPRANAEQIERTRRPVVRLETLDRPLPPSKLLLAPREGRLAVGERAPGRRSRRRLDGVGARAVVERVWLLVSERVVGG